MKFLIAFVNFDVSVSASLLGDSSTVSSIRHEIVDTTDHLYAECESIRDIEVLFEKAQNYPIDNDVVHNPAFKAKVLTVQPLPSSL
ncbi:hypothetical protein ACK3BE_09205 [Pseudomonas mandelii]|uniref:hypothetical protein n=1 Tax=Pseudomonas mandelii TaxID=75612 RepID=UPI00398CFF49